MKKLFLKLVKSEIRPNWKFYILLFIIISLIAIVILTYPKLFSINGKLFNLFPINDNWANLFSFNEWIKTIIIGGLMSIIASLIVSLFFTIKIDKQDYTEKFEKEINNMFKYLFQIQKELYKIAYDMTMMPDVKSLIMTLSLSVKPDLYILGNQFPEFQKLFDNTKDEIVDLIQNLDTENNVNFINSYGSTAPKIIFKYAKLYNELLKIQEWYFQKYAGAPKKEIKDELCFEEEIKTKKANEKLTKED